MKTIIHRGAEEIGGNCIELVSGKSRILLDYGAPLPKTNPITHKNIEISLEDAELNIDGLYPGDNGHLDGIIISHTHQDHYGMLFGRKIKDDLPVFMSEIMEGIIRITGKMCPHHQDLSVKIKHFQFCS